MECHPYLRGFNRMDTGFLATISWTIRVEAVQHHALEHKKNDTQKTCSQQKISEKSSPLYSRSMPPFISFSVPIIFLVTEKSRFAEYFI
jgi:hypothetical protein